MKYQVKSKGRSILKMASIGAVTLIIAAALVAGVANAESGNASTSTKTKINNLKNKIQNIKDKKEEQRASSTRPLLNRASTTPRADLKREAGSSLDPVCASKAIEERDATLAESAKKFGDAWALAFTKRSNNLKEAYAKTGTERIVAMKAAHNIFNTSRRDAGLSFNKMRTEAWTKFKIALKACGATDEDLKSEGKTTDTGVLTN